MDEKLHRDWQRAHAIADRQQPGLCEPIFWHLALRSYGPALLELAGRYTRRGLYSELGRASDCFSPLGMMLRAYRGGTPYAAQNLAMSYFNVGNMRAYRHWLRNAARSGDVDAEAAVKRFETRWPHRLAFRHRRGRPERQSQ